jgi:hypothetical protein
MRISVALLCLLCSCERALILTAYPPVDAGRDAGRATVLPPRDTGTREPDDESVLDANDPTEPVDAALGGAPPSELGATDPACDLTGYWAVKQSLIVQTALAGPLRVTTWYYMQLAQTGERALWVDGHECGQLAKGAAEQSISRDTLAVVVTKNSWRDRQVSVKREGDLCSIAFGRAWIVRGADPVLHLPAGVFARVGLAEQRAVPLPTRDAPEAAEDWNGGSGVGIAGRIDGTVSAVRWTTQRSYTEWLSNDAYPVAAGALERFMLAARFDAEVRVLRVDPPNLLLENLDAPAAPEHPDNQAELLLLGRDESAAAEWVGESDRVARCLRIQNQLLPY